MEHCYRRPKERETKTTFDYLALAHVGNVPQIINGGKTVALAEIS